MRKCPEHQFHLQNEQGKLNFVNLSLKNIKLKKLLTMNQTKLFLDRVKHGD